MTEFVKCQSNDGKGLYVNLAHIRTMVWDDNSKTTQITFGDDMNIEVRGTPQSILNETDDSD